MNNGEGFEKRWELRRGEVDGDTSSDDNRSNSSGDPTDPNHHDLVADLALLENDEGLDAACNSIHPQIAKAEEKKAESTKRKKKVVPKKSGGLSVKEKKKTKFTADEMVMFKDLKKFAKSLIQELAAAQDKMFAHMGEEMRKLATSRLSLEPSKKNVRRSYKKKACLKKGMGIETSVKPQNWSSGSIVGNVVSDHARKFETEKHETRPDELQKSDRSRLPSKVHVDLAYGSDHQLVSVLPKPQFQDQRNHYRLNDHIPSIMPMNNSGSEVKRHSHGLIELHAEERFGSFSQGRQQCVGLLGQNSYRGIQFSIPLNQGMDNGSNMSSLSYSENSIMDNIGVGLRMDRNIGRFQGRNPMPTERMVADSMISKMARESDGEPVAERLEDLKDGQIYRTSMRNDR